ncbi:hypothetical protein B0H13DRAFT_195213 [Mycena leptocephala]|nr:hypothetical protein B0H13DRAFT_195213 [Mycena leptocephala]
MVISQVKCGPRSRICGWLLHLLYAGPQIFPHSLTDRCSTNFQLARRDPRPVTPHLLSADSDISLGSGSRMANSDSK